MHTQHNLPRAAVIARFSLVLSPLVLSALVLSAVVLSARPGQAQVAPYTFSAPNAVASPGTTFSIGINLDSSQGNLVGAASYSVCFDPAVITPQLVLPGADLATVNNGAGPGFFSSDSGAGFFNVGFVVDVLGQVAIPVGPLYEMTSTTFLASGASLSSTVLDFCVTGAPPVTVVVVELGTSNSQTPSTVSGSVLVVDLFGTLDLVIPSTPVMGSSFTGTVTMDTADPFEGFRFGLGHDPVQVSPVSAVLSATLAALNGGAGPDLIVVDLDPSAGDGFTIDCVFDTIVGLQLPPGLTELVEVTYDAFVVPSSCVLAEFTFRDDLGVPVQIDIPTGPEQAGGFVVSTPITAIPPASPSGGVTLTVETVPSVPGALATVPVILDSDQSTQAFSFSASHSSPEYELTAIEPGLALLAIGCGVGPSFFDTNIPFLGTQYGSVISVFDLEPAPPDELLPASGALEVARLIYQVPAAPTANTLDVTVVNGLGTPPIALEVTANFQAIVPTVIAGGIQLGGALIRGDCNSDGTVNIADGIALLGNLFPTAPPLPITCQDACDANDDGAINIADAISILDSLFGSTTLPAPATCGDDPTSGDPLDCVSSGC